jgi:hypothetical protein
VQRGGLGRAAGEDERLERLELRIAVIDRLFELPDPRVGEARLGQLLLHLLQVGRGEQRPEGEEIALDGG